MDDAWVMVRIGRVTHARLCEVRESLLRAYEQGKIALDLDQRSRVSLSQVVELLIQQRMEHATRRKKAAAKRRTRSSRPTSPAT